MNKDDINDYLPSLLNPRRIRKQQGDLSLTQNSIVSRCSLSLKRKNCVSNVKNGVSNIKKNIHKPHPADKENAHINILLQKPSPKNVAKDKSFEGANLDCSTSLQLNTVCPLEKDTNHDHILSKILPNVYNVQNESNIIENSIGLSAVEDLITRTQEQNIESSPFSIGGIDVNKNNVQDKNSYESVVAVSSATELDDNNVLDNSLSTIKYEYEEKPVISVSFGIQNCEAVHVSTKSSNIKNILVTRKDCGMEVDCDVIECSDISSENGQNEMTQNHRQDSPKKSTVAVNLEIKKKTSTEETVTENSKVLILNTDAIERLSHVIVQPPNYKLVKRQISDSCKFKNNGKRKRESVFNRNGTASDNLKQKRIDCYFANISRTTRSDNVAVGCEDVLMSKNLGVADAVRCDRGRSASKSRRERPASPRARVPAKTEHLKNTASDARGQPKLRHDSANSAPSPRKNVDSTTPFTLPTKSTSNKTSVFTKNIPNYKIVAGTHFAVDAFSYGDIPNVKHYFLTHFHSDHYSGLKKTFNKVLFCTKITADLCISRLGVSPKCIHLLEFDENITIDGIEVTAVDANHCPGAMMLVFTLPSGKTLLHTGDFRASPNMESYPIFWNKDVHTIYLDSTYCNPRYDFPTQDQSLEMALYHLRQKKMTLEKEGKKFSSVLIVCGTYTIGKEKFFLGMARRVGCSVWACPEKDKVLQAVEGRSFGTTPPASCQLHVVPMRDLTHEKLRSYLESLQGAFSEVVAFKPSGWENGKNSTLVKGLVTIHGIPYSEHSSFSEMIRFVKFLTPKQVVPTVDISGGIKAVQKFFPCPLVHMDAGTQGKVTDYFSIQNRQQLPAGVT